MVPVGTIMRIATAAGVVAGQVAIGGRPFSAALSNNDRLSLSAPAT